MTSDKAVQEPTSQTVHDPVCHMDIVAATAAGSSEYQGHTYYFCSRGCQKDFEDDPEGVLKAESEYDHSQPMDHGMMMQSSGETKKKPWWKFW
jgi:YHS domain-containing protein